MTRSRAPAGRSRRRRASLVAALGLVGALVAGAVFVGVTGSGGETSARKTLRASSTRVSPTPAATRDRTEEPCEVSDNSDDIPDSTPDDLTWRRWRGVAVPSSRSAGPRRVDERAGITGCYAHTPLGALMAAANIDLRMVVAAPDTTIVDQQMAEGPYKKRYRAHIRSMEPPDTIAQLVGFSYLSFHEDTAAIRFAVGERTIGYASYVSTVSWQHGEWLAVAGPDDTDPNSMRPVSDFNGFVPLREKE